MQPGGNVHVELVGVNGRHAQFVAVSLLLAFQLSCALYGNGFFDVELRLNLFGN